MRDVSATWLAIGFVGQAIFTARFLVQWAASERRRDSVVPVTFWWLSLVGGLVVFAYACRRGDPVIVVGQSLGLFVYVRNLMLVAKGRRRAGRGESRRIDVGDGATPAPHRRAEGPARQLRRRA